MLTVKLLLELNFAPMFNAAVDQKKIAQQEAQRAHFLVQKAKQTKLEKIERAEGEAAAARLMGEAMKNDNNFLKIRKIQAGKSRL